MVEVSPEEHSYYAHVEEPGFLGKVIPFLQRCYNQQLNEAKARFQEAFKEYEVKEEKRLDEIGRLQGIYAKEKEEFFQKIKDRDKEIDEINAVLHSGKTEAVITCTTLVLEQSKYHEDSVIFVQ